jgi:hypothetical protein
MTRVFLVCLEAKLNLVFGFFLKDLELLSIFSLNACKAILRDFGVGEENVGIVGDNFEIG